MARCRVKGSMNCMDELPAEVAALLDVATERAAIRDAKARRESREDAEQDRREAERLGVSTAELPAFKPSDLA